MNRLIASVLCCFTLVSGALASDDPLRPEKAFRYNVSTESGTIIVDWTIEPEYYLYKKRMSFAVSNAAVTLGQPEYPQGETHEDEFFGKSEVFRNSARVRIPYSGNAAGDTELIIKSQGCADMGLCYPPQTWAAPINLPQALPATNAQSGSGLPDFIKQNSGISGLTANGDKPLPAADAFIVSYQVIDPFTVEIRWDVARGYYIYRDHIKTTVRSDTIQSGPLQLPQGNEVDDLEYGLTEVYYGEVLARLPLIRAERGAQSLALDLEFQGCKTDSICYPPQTIALNFELPAATTEAANAAIQQNQTMPVSEQGRLTRLIGSGNLAWVMLTFAGLGLLLAFTPCVLPMVPILSGIIAGQGDNITSVRAFLLSLTYVLGMAFTYTAAGVFFAAAGGQIQALLQQPWIISGVALLFVVLAMAMFGAFTLQLPAALQTRLTAASDKQQAGTFFGTAVMGALSALVVTTCVAPPLVAALTVIAETGDMVRGGASLFALSIGMGIPLLIIGTSAGKLIPKAGAWMDAVKELFGFMMLGLAIWMLERLLPGQVTIVLWSALGLAAGIRLLMHLRKIRSAAGRFITAAGGLAMLAYGLLLLAGATQGGTNPLKPLQAFSSVQESHLEFTLIKTVDDLDRQLAIARAENRYAMLDFYADWCVSCKEMEHYTFTDADVQESLANTLLLQADVTANDAADQALLARMGIFGPPTIIFFDRNGNEITGQRVIGFQSAERFLQHIETVQSD